MNLYTVTFSGVAVAGAQDLFELVAPSDSKVELYEVRIGQYTDFGDAHAEILPVRLLRGYTTTGSGGAAATPNPLMSGGKAAGSVCATNNTTLATGGSPLTMIADVMNVMAGWLYQPAIFSYPYQLSPFNERIKLAKGERLVVRIGAPAESLSMNGTLIFSEIGDV